MSQAKIERLRDQRESWRQSAKEDYQQALGSLVMTGAGCVEIGAGAIGVLAGATEVGLVAIVAGAAFTGIGVHYFRQEVQDAMSASETAGARQYALEHTEADA